MHLFSNLAFNLRDRLRSRIFVLALAGITGIALIAAASGSGHGSSSRLTRPLQEASTKSNPGAPGGGSAKKGTGTTSGSGSGTTTPTVSPLSYHGGAVFSSPYTIHDIYWVPPGYGVAGGYQSTIDGFARNLAAASGATTNVFDAATQYTDSAGNHVSDSATYGGSATVSSAFPASGCKDAGVKSGPCLTDMQVASEIQTVAAGQGWTVAYPNIYVMMMPKGVGNCATTSTGGLEGYCSFGRSACSWHHQWGGLYFIVMPDPATAGGCETGQSPSGVPEGDSAVDLISHELSETLTNPADGSWYDATGEEMADKCLNDFGTPLGGTTGHLYNQVINGTPYYLQGEWSNASSACVFQGT